MHSIIDKKYQNSEERLSELSKALQHIEELKRLKKLSVFVAGSYARKEASIHSDIDLFFVYHGYLKEHLTPNITSLRAFAKIIEEADRLSFPAFSNDGEFLKILEAPEMAKELGGRNDDHANFFTARMLMLLESTPIFNKNTYNDVLHAIVASYFRDYTHHPKDFKPIFLINDIIRFWKTLCLNYENKRNQPETDQDRKIKQKIKNFKLKFSRMLTCYGSITAIADLEKNSGPDEIIKLGLLTPLQRLEVTSSRRPITTQEFHKVKSLYEWFLQVTDVREDDLLNQFHNREFREEAFLKADQFGDSLYNIVHEVASETGYLRYLVI